GGKRNVLSLHICSVIITTRMEALIIIGYLVLAGALVYLSILLSNYVDMLDKTTKISGAILGGVLLAAVTSLPELFTTLTAVVGVGEYGYVLGNILGSDIFDIIVLAVLLVIFIKNVHKAKIGKSNYIQFIILLAMYVVIILAVMLPENIKKYFTIGGCFNALAILLLAFYVISLFVMDKTEVKEESNEQIKYTTKQIIIRFAICSVLLIGCSIGVTFMSDMIVQRFEIDPTAAGATLLGIMTSLPEVISTFNLFYKKNLNAGAGNMIGSAVFNMIIIFLSELVSFNGSVFTQTPEVNKLIILGIISIVACFVALLFKLMGKKENCKNLSLVLVAIFSIISFAGYVLYLVLPNSLF
ncbi:MAG TPA: hypothetical protein DCY93_03325, partial [Firmicutes bacterium]|nr:hypothetical protein [Bacillota bacterium]